MKKLVGRISLTSNVYSDAIQLENPTDREHFVPGLPLWFCATPNGEWLRSTSRCPVVTSVDGATIRFCQNLTWSTPAIAAGDYIFVITDEACPTCGSIGMPRC
jgi:hypothetical protein